MKIFTINSLSEAYVAKSCFLRTLNFAMFAGVEVDDFIEASSALVQPLENFFNNVFVMVVSACCPLDSILLN